MYTGTVCAEYNIGGTCIQRNGEVTCDACPILYKSTESFKCKMICIFLNKVAWGVTYPIAICFCSTSFIVRHACRPTPVTFIFLVSRTYLGIAFFVKAIVVEGIQPIWKITTSFKYNKTREFQNFLFWLILTDLSPSFRPRMLSRSQNNSVNHVTIDH